MNLSAASFYPCYAVNMVGNRWHESDDAINFKNKSAMPDYIFNAAKHSINNRDEVEKSINCGCYYCLYCFRPQENTEWVNSSNDEFPMCPRCGIDAVIGDMSGYAVTTRAFLKEMNHYWFYDVAEEVCFE